MGVQKAPSAAFRRNRAARRLREEVLGRHHHTDVYRLINAEGDGLSGQETTAREERYLKVALLHGE